LGPVFRAYDAERERLVAVKLFTLDLPPEKVHQLVAEFERLIAAELTHPALALPLATGITGVSAFLAQDYVAAESLDLAVREYGAAPPVDVMRVAAQLAGALDFAAVVDISHGALHPRDVLLSTDDTRLTGIGVARALEVVGVAVPVRRPYTPPERIAGAAWDRRADVFSLAAMIHELLWARRISGTGMRAVENLTHVEGGDLDRLRAAFGRALADDPAERFETALEFAEALKAAFPDVVLTPPAPLDRRARKPRKTPRETSDTPGTSEQSVRAEPVEPVEPMEPRLPLVADLFTHEPPPPDLELRTDALEALDMPIAPLAPVDEPPRFQELDESPVAPPAKVVRIDRTEPRIESRVELPSAVAVEPSLLAEPEMLSMLDRSRSAVWPLVLALAVGIAMGFAAGYGIGSQRQSGASSTSGSKEFTEGAVAEMPKPDDAAKVQPGHAAAAAPPAPAAALAAPAHPAPAETRPAAPPADEAGRLLVRSTPAGARVFVDGREMGRTPESLDGVARGSHRVRVTHDGYVDSERRVTITRSRPTQAITVSLARERSPEPRRAAASAPTAPASAAAAAHGPAAVRVESRPAGASVYVDGKLVGTTPVSLAAVEAGDHSVRITRDGYKPWSGTVHVAAGEQNRVTASLER
jgi:serine/threonine-protein kinase